MSHYVELQQFQEEDSGNAGQSLPLEDFEGHANEAEFLFDDDGNLMNPKEGYKKVARNRFIGLIARFPKSFALGFILIPIICSVAGLFFPLQIDFGIDSFRIQDEVVAARWDGLHAAETEYWTIRDEVDKKSATLYSERMLADLKSKRYSEYNDKPSRILDYYSSLKKNNLTVNESDPYPWESLTTTKKTSPLTYRKWKMQVVFVVDKGDDVFTPERLQAMMETQIAMTQQSGYHDHCWSHSSGYCQPPESPLLAFYPEWESYTVHNVPLLTEDQIDYGIALILTNGIYGFTSSDFSAGNPKSYLLRIQFNWGTPLRGYSGYNDRRAEQYAKSEEFIDSYIPFFADYPDPYRTMSIYHGGDYITAQEIRNTFWSDASYAIGSLLMIFLFLWFNMGSIFLAIAGIFEICISFPSVYFVYRAGMGVPFVGILNGVALFIILGIGVDDLFIFYNSFMQGSNIQNLEDRIAWTYQKAAKATFSAAFAANAASEIPALRLFGLLMAMMVTVNYLLVISFFPAILIIWHTDWQKVVRMTEPNWYKQLLEKLSTFENYLCLSGQDNDPATKHLRASEKFFYKRFAPLVHKARWVLIVILLAIMVGGLMVSRRLTPSNTVPKFFDDNNNIQKFLDWDLDGFLNSDGITQSTGCSSPYEFRDICGVCGGDGSTCTTTGQATTGQATTGQATTGQATTGQATTGQATTGQATTGQATTGQATTGQATTGQATTGQATTGQATTGQATTGQATTGQATTGQATTGQATTGQATTGQATTGHATTGQATTGQVTTGAHTTGSQTTGHATTGQATTGQATTGHATTGQSTTGSTTGQSTTGSGGCDGHGSYYDACGICGGNNACVGCDGVPNSGAQYDYCGVCNGDNACVPPPTDSKRYVTISLVWGIKGIDRSTADVNDVFGAVQGSPIYDSSFDPTKPESQTAILNMCLAANNYKELVQINGRQIMMAAFQSWLLGKGYSFPAPSSNFVSLMHSFIDSHWDDFKDSVGFLYSGSTPYALAYIRQDVLSSTIFLHQSSFDVLKEFDKWEDFMKDLNKLAPSTANKAYQTDDIYVRAYTEVAAVNGITQSLIISSCVAIAGLLLFTGNIVVALIATIILIANIIVLLAFYQLMGWTLGAIEAISITILVGLSVDYLFHIADAYCIADKHSPKPLTRFEKVQIALTEMGMSSLSGAITTVSSGLMLLFCEIQIFYKFGLVIAITLSVSLVFTLFFLCALLSVCGPTGHFGDLFWLVKLASQKLFHKAQQQLTKKADYKQASSLWTKEDTSELTEGKFTIEDEDK